LDKIKRNGERKKRNAKGRQKKGVTTGYKGRIVNSMRPRKEASEIER